MCKRRSFHIVAISKVFIIPLHFILDVVMSTGQEEIHATCVMLQNLANWKKEQVRHDHFMSSPTPITPEDCNFFMNKEQNDLKTFCMRFYPVHWCCMNHNLVSVLFRDRPKVCTAFTILSPKGFRWVGGWV